LRAQLYDLYGLSTPRNPGEPEPYWRLKLASECAVIAV
jgi:hypothetical protein